MTTFFNRMKSFKNAIEGTTKALSGSKCTPFVEFTVGDLKMSTYSKLDYFMQLDVNYAGTGIGSANQFTVSIAYVPKPYQDPNAIDKALAGVTADNDPCFLRFGYSGIKGFNLVTQEYECLVLGYSTSLREGIIYYTITGVSTALSFRELRFNFPPIENENPLNVLYNWTHRIFENNGDKKEHKRGDANIIHTDYKLRGGYKIEIANNADKYVKPQSISAISDVTIYEYLDTVLINLEDRDPNAVFWYSISDLKGDKTITIHRTIINSDLSNDLYGKGNQVLFTFDWGGNHQDNTTNNLVMSFETEYKGEVNIATTDDIIEKRYAYDSSGNIVQVSGMEEFEVGDYVEKDSTVSNRTWARSLDWAYNASIELAGIPADIPIGAIISVNPMFYGQKHHTAGLYMITGAKCNINSNGFSTNLSLFKIIIDSTSLQYQMLKDSLVKTLSGLASLMDDVRNKVTTEEAKQEDTKTYSGKDYVYTPDAFKIEKELSSVSTHNGEKVENNHKARTRKELRDSEVYLEIDKKPLIDPSSDEFYLR